MRSSRDVESSRIPLVAALVVFVVHVVANPHYGFFRDELYFIICGRHPQWGYVDQPPVVPLLAALSQAFGHSLLLLRAVPALFAAGGAYVTCLLVLEFGGGAFAQVLAALVYFFTPVLTSFGMKAGTDEVGLFTWPLIALLVVRLTRGADARWWLLVGALAGISLQSKYSVIFFLVALVAGLLATGERRALWTPWFAAGGGVAALIALPNLAWQAHYGFPMMELLRNGQNGKNVIPSPALYALQELLITNPLLAPAWLAGLFWLLFAPRFRFLAYAYIVLIAEMLGLHGKHYYPANVYPILIAAGGVAFEAWTGRLRLLRGPVLAYAFLAGLLMLPDVLPILPEATFVAYSQARDRALHVSEKMTETEHGREDSLLPADWADMHGWPEMAAATQRVYDALPPAERSRAVVLAGNYGEASAVAFFTPDVPVVSPHNQFWLWGTHGFSGNPIVQINGTCFEKRKLFRSRTRAATFSSPYAINYENDIPIWICRDPVEPLAAVWPEIKNYN
jgi:Dolichyl-phosphate-mannose-protein mannosyltransferase